MNITVAGKDKNIAVVSSEDILITDAQSALDLMVTVKYEAGCSRIVLDQSLIDPDFFRLGTGLAGEILQKYTNYHIRLAIVGDFSVYTSKPLRDFMFESNKGRNVLFVSTLEQAIERLGDQ